ncbi:RING-H2 finger protein ATL8 [Linum perenne]
MWAIYKRHWVVVLAFFLGLLLIRIYLKKLCCRTPTETEILPVVVHGSHRMAVGDECSICLGDFVDGERVRVLPKCNHEFHVWCIDKWLAAHATCPNCRESSCLPSNRSHSKKWRSLCKFVGFDFGNRKRNQQPIYKPNDLFYKTHIPETPFKNMTRARVIVAVRRCLVHSPEELGLPLLHNTTDPKVIEAEFYLDLWLYLAVMICAALVSIGIIWFKSRNQPPPPVKTRYLISCIPVAVFESGAGPAQVTSECSICLGEFLDGESVRVLPECDHEFHVACIDKWLALHSSCPNCRKPVMGHKLGGNRTGPG